MFKGKTLIPPQEKLPLHFLQRRFCVQRVKSVYWYWRSWRSSSPWYNACLHPEIGKREVCAELMNSTFYWKLGEVSVPCWRRNLQKRRLARYFPWDFLVWKNIYVELIVNCSCSPACAVSLYGSPLNNFIANALLPWPFLLPITPAVMMRGSLSRTTALIYIFVIPLCIKT